MKLTGSVIAGYVICSNNKACTIQQSMWSVNRRCGERLDQLGSQRRDGEGAVRGTAVMMRARAESLPQQQRCLLSTLVSLHYYRCFSLLASWSVDELCD